MKIPWRRPRRKPTPVSIYGPDPGDASVEYYYGAVRENIRNNIAELRSYPNEGPREKESFLAKTMAPRSRWKRALLFLAFRMTGTGRNSR